MSLYQQAIKGGLPEKAAGISFELIKLSKQISWSPLFVKTLSDHCILLREATTGEKCCSNELLPKGGQGWGWGLKTLSDWFGAASSTVGALRLLMTSNDFQ